MNDGGMGSFLIFQNKSDINTKWKFGKQISEFEFIDDDGVIVLVSIYVDEQNSLFEVDVWKTNFEPVLKIKTPQLNIKGKEYQVGKTRTIISKICICALIMLSLYLSNKSYENEKSLLLCLLIGLCIILIPLFLCFLASLIKKQLFHYTLWAIIISIIGLFSWNLTLPDSTNSQKPKWDIAASKHFRDKAGIFSSFSTVVTSNEYKNNNTDSEYYIVNIIYLKGRKNIGNYYMGKVQIDHNYKFSKEFYDIQAISDTALLRAEYGNLAFLLSFIPEFQQRPSN